LCEPDPVHYDEQFSKLLMALGEVSPVIEPAEPGRAFIGVDGLEKLYGTAEQQVKAIKGVQQIWGEIARMGWGFGKFTAWVAATRAKPGHAVIVSDAQRAEFLAQQPVSVLPINPDTHRRLRQLGISTLNDLARLPRVAVVSQFGRTGHRLWSLAQGAALDPVIGQETPEPIVAEIDFPTATTDRISLEHALDRLVEKALRHPRRSGWRVLQVRARARQEHGASWMTQVTLRNPSADRDHITAPLKTRLQQVPLTGAVETIAVELTDFTHGTDELQLFARDASSSARAGRRQALRRAVREIHSRFNTSLYHVIEVHPQSRIPERRYALIDYEP
jgi:DNA polymerase-4